MMIIKSFSGYITPKAYANNYPTFQSNALKPERDTEVRIKEAPSFADINMLGKCNLNCFFCVGKELEKIARQKGKNINLDSNMGKHFSQWQNFEEFLAITKKQNIKKLYLTGSNTDPSTYKYLHELIEYLKESGFVVGIRTNGYFDLTKQSEILKSLNGTVSYSLQSLNPETNKKITGVAKIPDWDNIIPNSGDNVRATIVVNRYNVGEIYDMIKYLSKFDNIKYIQLRSIYAETADFKLKYAKDIQAFKNLSEDITKKFEYVKSFKNCPIYRINGKEVVLWDLGTNTINANNYYTDGSFHQNYYVVAGYTSNLGAEKSPKA
ncbi:MAG: radical SAM protein [bacterium]|nr:radical SAM protein [bacterium]